MKNRGGLHFGSNDVNFICVKTEESIRNAKDLFHKDINRIVIRKTLRKIPKTIFNSKHFFDFKDHRSQLVVLIIQKYINIRLKHESTILKDKNQRIRMQNNKLTIFKGQ